MRKSQSYDSLLFDPETERTAKVLRKARREELKQMAENRGGAENIVPVPIRIHFRQVINNNYSGIALKNITANNFELKPALINMVQKNQIRGAATEDPNLQLRAFLETSYIVKIHAVTEDTTRL